MKYYDHNEEREVLHKGCILPLFIFATCFILILVVHNSKTKDEAIIKDKTVLKGQIQTNVNDAINNNTKDTQVKEKLYKDWINFKKKLPRRIDDNTIIEDVEYTGNDIFFKYLVNDYVNNIDKNKYKNRKRRLERGMAKSAIEAYPEYNNLDITFHYSFHNELGEELFNFKLYTNYLNKGLELYNVNGKLYIIPYNKELDFLAKYPNARIPEDTIGTKYSYYDAINEIYNKAIKKEVTLHNTKWNPKTCIYSDYTHGFSWQFPLTDWQLTSGNEKHTIFKVIERNTNITAFVNINPIETNKNYSEDIFNIYEKMVQMEDQLEKQAETVTGLKTIQSHRKKVRFGGKNAIKRRYITELIDDRYKEPVRVIAYTYTFIYNKAIWSVTLKCHKTVYDILLHEENLDLEEIFKGFDFIHIQ